MPRTNEELDELATIVAHQIVTALRLFDSEPPHVQQQAHQIVMQRVQRTFTGENLIIEGEGLVREIPEPGQTETINTAAQEGGSSEAV